MLKAFPKGTRTAPRLLKLWKHAYQTGNTAKKKWDRRKAKVSNKGEVRRLDREMQRWQRRMLAYHKVLNSKPTQTTVDGKVVKGLLLSPKGAMHIADAVWPLSFGNQTQVLLDHEKQRYTQLFLDLNREAAQMLKKAKDGAKTLADNAGKIGIAVLATVVGGYILAKTTD
jgi:hypothetical protein